MASGCKVWCCVWSWWQAETSLDPTPGLWRELRTQVLMTRPEREFLPHLNVKPLLQCFLKGPFLVLTAHNQPFGVPGSPTAHPGRCPFGRGDAMQQGAGTATALWLHKDVCQWHLQQLWQTQVGAARAGMGIEVCLKLRSVFPHFQKEAEQGDSVSDGQ